ncbi:MAG: hypothetical protein NVSMB52_08010 [Chloroflexota bacterium]
MWWGHAKYTVGVTAFLLNDRDELLLMRHRFRESDGWQFPGGYVRRGEQPEAALQRELREETGYEVEILCPVSVRTAYSLHLDLRFLARVRAGNLVIDRREVIEARFFPYAELRPFLDEATKRAIDRVRSEPS